MAAALATAEVPLLIPLCACSRGGAASACVRCMFCKIVYVHVCVCSHVCACIHMQVYMCTCVRRCVIVVRVIDLYLQKEVCILFCMDASLT
jgi:hypothetical protein